MGKLIPMNLPWLSILAGNAFVVDPTKCLTILDDCLSYCDGSVRNINYTDLSTSLRYGLYPLFGVNTLSEGDRRIKDYVDNIIDGVLMSNLGLIVSDMNEITDYGRYEIFKTTTSGEGGNYHIWVRDRY